MSFTREASAASSSCSAAGELFIQSQWLECALPGAAASPAELIVREMQVTQISPRNMSYLDRRHQTRGKAAFDLSQVVGVPRRPPENLLSPFRDLLLAATGQPFDPA